MSNNGPLVQAFERRLAEFLGVRQCVAMCNGTIALEIAIRALELRGEVIVPSYTFIATAHALQWQEITPVFADINPHTHNLDPEAVRRMITPRTTGILGVHLWGRACPVEELQAVAEEYRLKLMFDARLEVIERALVAKDLEPFGIYAGSPLKRIEARSRRLLELEKQYLAASG